MSIISRLKNFNQQDIRNKLKSINRKLKINVYPDFFYNSGLRSIYSKIIFNLIFNEKSRKIRKRNHDFIFKRKKNKNKINFLIAPPRSGSNLIRNLISSYIELFYHAGNGVPKYDGLNDKWRRGFSTVISGHLYGFINLDTRYLKILNLIPLEEFEKKKIIISRHPIQKADLFDINLAKPLIVIRKPDDQIKSWYLTYHYEKRKKLNEMDIEKINLMIEKNFQYYKFWESFVQGKKRGEDYMILQFSELQHATKNSFEKILNFYNYEINQGYLNKASELNSKENYLKYFGEGSKRSIRFAKKYMFDVDKITKVLENSEDFKKIFKYFASLSSS